MTVEEEQQITEPTVVAIVDEEVAVSGTKRPIDEVVAVTTEVIADEDGAEEAQPEELENNGSAEKKAKVDDTEDQAELDVEEVENDEDDEEDGDFEEGADDDEDNEDEEEVNDEEADDDDELKESDDLQEVSVSVTTETLTSEEPEIVVADEEEPSAVSEEPSITA